MPRTRPAASLRLTRQEVRPVTILTISLALFSTSIIGRVPAAQSQLTIHGDIQPYSPPEGYYVHVHCTYFSWIENVSQRIDPGNEPRVRGIESRRATSYSLHLATITDLQNLYCEGYWVLYKILEPEDTVFKQAHMGNNANGGMNEVTRKREPPTLRASQIYTCTLIKQEASKHLFFRAGIHRVIC